MAARHGWQALASLLRTRAPELQMRVNMRVCADCHSFLGHAVRKGALRKLTFWQKFHTLLFKEPAKIRLYPCISFKE